MAEKKGQTQKIDLPISVTDDELKIIKELEENFPGMTGTFKKIIADDYVTFCKKQYDYGPQNISVGTQLKDNVEIHISLTGLWFRINDKIQRLFNLILKKQEAQNESIEDSFKDLSVYGVIARIVQLGKWGK